MPDCLVMCAVGGLLVACGCRGTRGHPPLAIPVEAKVWAGEWFGFVDRETTAYKLVLDSGGGGVCYAITELGTITTNCLATWAARGAVLVGRFSSPKVPTELASFTCEMQRDVLVAEVRGAGGWTERIQFRRSEYVQQQMRTASRMPPLPGTVAVPQ